MKAFASVILCVALVALSACGGDDDEGDSSSGGSGGGAPQGSACSRGCAETLAADCDNGPASQAECESDCEALESGDCGAEYGAFQTCAEGETITCSPAGLPSVEACASEQQAFIDCLN